MNIAAILLIAALAAAPATAAVSDAEFIELKRQMMQLAARVQDLETQNAQLKGEQQTGVAEVEVELSAVIAKLDRKGFNVSSSDNDYAIKVGTRLHGEGSTSRGDLPAGIQENSGFELRRARIETKGKIAANWRWAAEADFADNKVSIKDFWLGYITRGGTKLSFGHQKQPFNLAIEMSSNDLPFIERSVDHFLLSPFVDRAIGFRVEKSGDNWYAAGGLFGESVVPNAATGNEGWGVVGRFVYAPILEDNKVLHLGVRAANRYTAENNNSIRVRDETTHLSSLRVVDTTQITGIEDVVLSGFEAAYATGPFSLVGEYNRLSGNSNTNTDVDFDSWSVYTTWSLTGESRANAYRINSGEFKRLTPATNFGDGGTGALELAFRYADIDLNDGLTIGGQESVFTSALNWYPNTNIRFMFEWSRVVGTDDSSALRQAADGLDIFQVRSQYTF